MSDQPSRGKALANSLLLGGVQIATSALGLVKNKAAALLLGPVGVGLYGTYANLLDFVSTLTGLGLSNSGVRHVAEAGAKDDPRHAHEVAVSLRRILMVLGAVGVAVFLAMAKLLSGLTFGDASRTGELLLVAPCILLSNLFVGHTALLRGRSEVGRLSRLMLMASVADAVIVVTVLCLVETHTVSVAMTASFAAKVLVARRLMGRDDPAHAPVPWARTWEIGGDMLKVGAAFLVSSLVFTGVTYLIRREVALGSGLVELGYYSAAYGLAYLFIGFVIAGIVSGFYPLAVARIVSDKGLQQELSEQLLAGLILTGPLVALGVLFRDWLIQAVFSPEFAPAAATLRWFLLGCLVRVVHAPLCYVIIANRDARTFVATELAFGAIGLGFAAVLIPRLGIEGAGAAFLLNLAVNTAILLAVVRRRNGLAIKGRERALLAASLAASLLAAVATPASPWIFALSLLANLALALAAARLARAQLPPEHRLNRLLSKILPR